MEKVRAAHRDIDQANEAIAAYLGRRELFDPIEAEVGEMLITEAVLALIGFRLKSETEGHDG